MNLTQEQISSVIDGVRDNCINEETLKDIDSVLRKLLDNKDTQLLMTKTALMFMAAGVDVPKALSAGFNMGVVIGMRLAVLEAIQRS